MPDVPAASKTLSEKYRRILKDRVERFSGAKRNAFLLEDIDHNALPGWRHQLYHDAESLFWLLVYWAVQALPDDCDADKITQVPDGLWGNFIRQDGHDTRDTLFKYGKLATGLIHPGFSRLGPLLLELWKHVDSDRYWAPRDAPHSDPEFLVEAMERIIISFLIDEQNTHILHVKKHPTKGRMHATPFPPKTPDPPTIFTEERRNKSPTKRSLLSGDNADSVSSHFILVTTDLIKQCLSSRRDESKSESIMFIRHGWHGCQYAQ